MPNISHELSFMLPIAATIILGLAAISISRFERMCQKLMSFWNSPTGAALQEPSAEVASLESQLRALQTTMEAVLQEIQALQQAQTKPQADKDRALPLANLLKLFEW